MPWTIGVDSELQVVRRDPEYADMDHPNGEIVEERFFLLAENERGDRRRYGCFLTAADAEAAKAKAPSLDVWSDTHPAYGSQAWIEYGEEEQMATERAFDECDGYFDTRFMTV